MFRGSFTALVTPFKNGGLDERAFRDLVEWQIAEGTDGLVPVGTTGESPTLSHEEHHKVVDLCIDQAKGRVPVIAGAGSNSTAEAIDLARHAEKAGATAVLVVTPYYNKPTQDGLYRHYMAINDAINIPIIIYNIPGRSVIDMSVDTMAKLAKLKNIAGVKDATAKLDRVSLQRQECGEDFIQLSGEDGDGAGLQRAWRSWVHFRDIERGAAALCRIPGRVPSGRLREGAQDSGPVDAVACRAVRRKQSGASEVCAVATRQVLRPLPLAARTDTGEHQAHRTRGDGSRGTDQRLRPALPTSHGEKRDRQPARGRAKSQGSISLRDR